MDTIDTLTWKLPLQEAHFHKSDLLSVSKSALINPAFPFIAAPLAEFETFKNHLQSEHTDDQLNCNRDNTCFFFGTCESIHADVPSLSFRLGDGDTAKYFQIPSSAFLFEQLDGSTELPICYLGLVGQNFTTSDQKLETYWILGDIFIQNFYTIFDADGAHPRVGLTLETDSLGLILDTVETAPDSG